MEYIQQLREQQLKYAETFNRNMQNILEEKESLKNENEQLQLKITRAESDYHTLSESLKINELEELESSEQDTLALRNGFSALESENRDLKNANRQLQARIEQLEIDASENNSELVKSRQETKSLSELLALEKKENNKQRELVSLYAGIIEELQEEVKRFKTVLSDGEMTKLGIKISELMANASLKEEIIDRYKNELEHKSDELGILTGENESLRYSMDQLKSTIISLTVQNEKLMNANHELSINLETENKRIIQLLNEKSEQTVEKLIAVRKIDELNMKLALTQLLPESTEDDAQKPEIVESLPAS